MAADDGLLPFARNRQWPSLENNPVLGVHVDHQANPHRQDRIEKQPVWHGHIICSAVPQPPVPL
eukprot:12427280-Karenia_brevis.AAC.1